MKKFLLTVLICLMPAMGLAASIDQKVIIIGSGHISGDFFPIAGGICKSINETRIKHGLRCLVDATEGSVYNLSALRAGDVDFAVAQSDWAYHAFKGTERFETVGPNDGLRQVVPILAKPLGIMVAKNAGINKVEDLKGKNIYIGPTEQSSEVLLKILVNSLGWGDNDMVRVKELETNMGEALCAGDVDAIVFTLTHPNGAIQQVANNCPVKFLDLKSDSIDRLIEQTPDVVPIILPGGLYGGVETENLYTFGYTISLYTLSTQPNDLVGQMVKILSEDQEEFQSSHPALKSSNFNPLTGRQAQIPYHKGATDFFKKINP